MDYYHMDKSQDLLTLPWHGSSYCELPIRMCLGQFNWQEQEKFRLLNILMPIPNPWQPLITFHEAMGIPVPCPMEWPVEFSQAWQLKRSKKLPKSVSYWHCHQSRETNLICHERGISLHSVHSLSVIKIIIPLPFQMNRSDSIVCKGYFKTMALILQPLQKNTIPFCFRQHLTCININLKRSSHDAINAIQLRRFPTWRATTTHGYQSFSLHISSSTHSVDNYSGLTESDLTLR